jgi:hypothetical protein
VQDLPEEVSSDEDEIDLSGIAPPVGPEVVRTKVMSLDPMSVQDALDQVNCFLRNLSTNPMGSLCVADCDCNA